MDGPALALLAPWSNFYVIIGGSAGALTGLQFVVMALVADTPGLGSMDTVDAFGTPTVFHFCVALFVSALMAAPWSAVAPVYWLLLLTGLTGVVYTLVGIRRALRQTAYHPVAEDWIWHSVVPLISYATLAAGAVCIARDMQAALFIPATAVLALVFVGIHNAWDTVAYIAVHRRDKG